MIQNIVCSFLGTVGFSVVSNVPREFALYCGLTGMTGFVTYVLLLTYMSPAFSAFFATMLVVLLSRIFAVWRKCPITVFLIPGIIPLVPGTYVYYTAYYFVMNELSLALAKGIDAMKLAFAIVLGIVFIVSIPRQFFSIQYWKKQLSHHKN
ncbi:MAG: threonine/serine exporter family protein [Tyzzerella sp.]|nr:threonine/serine exporter family protein [Tyzzerella sp.]